MNELKDVLIFCALYSGVVLFSLVTTLRTASLAPAKVRRD